MNFKNTALLVIDLQMVSWPEEFYGVPDMPQIVENIKPVLSKCREQSIPIIYTRQFHRKNGADTSLGEPWLANGYPYMEGTEGVEIIRAISPEPGDLVVDKHRWSAFFNTELEIILRRLEINHLMLCGVVTDCCVMLTAYDAFFRDYQVTVVKDCCGATTAAIHQASIVNMANWIYQSRIIKAAELVKALEGKPHSKWEWETPGAFELTQANLAELYANLE